MSHDSSPRRTVCDQLLRHQRLVVTSHVRPDGDAIGSTIALAQALRSIGKSASVVMRDPVPSSLTEFPGVAEVIVSDTVPADTEAVIVLECGDLDRTGLSGLDHCLIINVDHHEGNGGYGDVKWFDAGYAAVGEMVFEIIEALGAPMSAEAATLLYVAVVTDTGSFCYPGVGPRTFGIAAKLVAAGADPALTARRLFDSNTVARLRLQGAVLRSLDIRASGRLALLYIDDAVLAESGAMPEDTDGLINLPLSVKAIQAVAFFKPAHEGHVRVSLRSKGDLDVGAIARGFGGGGHRNASGCTIVGDLSQVRDSVLAHIVPEIDARTQSSRTDN